MGSSWELFLTLIFIFLGVQAYFSMIEMALVSFNRVRLQYYVSQNKKRAIWISHLLSNPTRLFGTTLIGVNASLQIGSECARRFYASLDMSPDYYAPITQIILVVLFAELTPMFAARAYAENVAILGIPILNLFSWILSPAIWLLQLLTRIANRLFPSALSPTSYLTREELQRAIEARGEIHSEEIHQPFSTITNHILALRSKTPKDLMTPLQSIAKIPNDTTIPQLKEVLSHKFTPYIALYQYEENNILGIVFARELLRVNEGSTITELARSTWFVTEQTSIHQILKQFRRNAQQLAVVLDESGRAAGVITLDAIINDIFYGSQPSFLEWKSLARRKEVHIDRSFPSDTSIVELNAHFHLCLPTDEKTLEDLMESRLGHQPKKGESIKIEGFELVLEDVSLMIEKTIRLRTY